MKLPDLVGREPAPDPWTEGEKIPWHEPEFSRRMLEEHLSQHHDAASRRLESSTMASTPSLARPSCSVKTWLVPVSGSKR